MNEGEFKGMGCAGNSSGRVQVFIAVTKYLRETTERRKDGLDSWFQRFPSITARSASQGRVGKVTSLLPESKERKPTLKNCFLSFSFTSSCPAATHIQKSSFYLEMLSQPHLVECFTKFLSALIYSRITTDRHSQCDTESGTQRS